MYKRMKFLLIPLLAALALPTSVSAKFIYLNYGSNNYQNKHLLITYGGGGSGKSQEEKLKKKIKQEKAKSLFKKRQAEKKAAEGLPLTEEEKRILGL